MNRISLFRTRIVIEDSVYLLAKDVQLVTFQASEPFRGMGVGRKLFEKAAGATKGHGAKKLYISAHSSKESQAAYKALGCVHAEEIIPWIADEEPFDVQMEYVL